MRSCCRVLVPFLVITALLSGGAVSVSAGTDTLKDAMGREVSVVLPVDRIVSLAPSATEILFAIGADGLLVGVSKHCDYPVAAKLKPKAGDFNSPDMEKVKALAPDIVLFAEYAREEDLQALEEGGIAAFVLPAASVHEIILAVRQLGSIAGRVEPAEQLAAAMETDLETLKRSLEKISRGQPPRVYIEVDGPKRLYAVGPGSFMDDVITIAGGRNAFAHRGSAYFPVESEEVLRVDPEVVLIDYPFQYKVGASKRPGWERMSAVKNGRVYDGTDFDIILLNRPGPRILQSLREIAALLHPGVFNE